MMKMTTLPDILCGAGPDNDDHDKTVIKKMMVIMMLMMMMVIMMMRMRATTRYPVCSPSTDLSHFACEASTLPRPCK